MNLDWGPLTLALAMLVGVVVQGVATHLRVPGIVLLLIAGVGLGPDGANVIRPGVMGTGLGAVVSFAVAVILFEGGLSLRLEVLRAQAKPIRRLVTVGPLITTILAAAAARLILGWDLRLSVLFGTLVIVTGPTVVTPLVKRLRLASGLMWILIAEGIFIDAVGATIAVVALEVAIAGSGGEAAAGLASIFLRFGVGAVVGAAGGALLAGLLRVRRLVPHGLENVLAVATAVASYQISHSFVRESGIIAAIVAGLVVGNARVRLQDRLADFNEQLTVLFVATLFVLLAADVRLADVAALGWRGALVVAAVMLVVRPVNVFVSTRNTELTTREKAYISWVAPRGIVAAAVASLFALELSRAGVEGGAAMRALVFVVIAATVTLQGLTAALAGTLLGVRKPPRVGYLILGANPLGRLLGGVLAKLGQRVAIMDRAEEPCREAREAGLEAIQGDGLESEGLDKAGIELYAHAVGVTTNEHVNYLFARTIADDHRGPELYIALERPGSEVTRTMAGRHDVGLLFGPRHELLPWVERARRGAAPVTRWKLGQGRDASALAELPADLVLPLALVRGNGVELFTTRSAPRGGDELVAAVAAEAQEHAAAWFEARGWTRVDAEAAAPRTQLQAPR